MISDYTRNCSLLKFYSEDSLCDFRLYEELLSAEVLQPVTGLIEGENDHPFYAPPEGTKHYMTPTGISSLVKYFINKSGG